MSAPHSPGDPVATLASLSLTPLRLDRIKEIRPASAQVDVDGQAVIFASAPFARMPSDLPARLALALFDVAGAAPQVARRDIRRLCAVRAHDHRRQPPERRHLTALALGWCARGRSIGAVPGSTVDSARTARDQVL